MGTYTDKVGSRCNEQDLLCARKPSACKHKQLGGTRSDLIYILIGISIILNTCVDRGIIKVGFIKALVFARCFDCADYRSSLKTIAVIWFHKYLDGGHVKSRLKIIIGFVVIIGDT